MPAPPGPASERETNHPRADDGSGDGGPAVDTVMDPDAFRRVMGCFASGVTVVTTRQPDGTPCGLTANAVASLSLVPPLVLVCIDRKAESHGHFGRAGVFAVNVLADRQQGVSTRFAVSGGDKFAGVPFRWGAAGAPILEEHLAYIECRIVHAYPGGDHTIYVGEVQAAGSGDGMPLLFYKGAYASLGRTLPAGVRAEAPGTT